MQPLLWQHNNWVSDLAAGFPARSRKRPRVLKSKLLVVGKNVSAGAEGTECVFKSLKERKKEMKDLKKLTKGQEKAAAKEEKRLKGEQTRAKQGEERAAS